MSENKENIEEEQQDGAGAQSAAGAQGVDALSSQNAQDATDQEPQEEKFGENSNILQAELGEEMQTSFLEYSMSVIVSRALPDVRDGLKPVHRRILYAMEESGVTPNKPHVKSARPVGDCMGKYHPHGDAAIYDTMVRLAQPFSLRVPLIDGHGNFGSIDGDSAAAMRYTEARLDKAAMELLRDLDKNTVDFIPNYDESLEEPSVLPARFPNLLVNGSNGIAVGMATNIPPHNLTETIDACCAYIDNPEISVDELMQIMPGPDFPTGGVIMGRKGIRDYYTTGRGSLCVRAKARIEDRKNSNGQRIVISEIPYQVNRRKLLEKLGELTKEKKFPEISNIHDAADRNGIDIIIDVKKDAIAQVVLNKLYKHTQLQTGFGVIMLALVEGEPKVLTLKQVLEHYVNHQREVITRRTQYDLNKAQEREHILEGFIIALDNIDEVIQIIRSSETDKEAGERLRDRFGLSVKQTDAILEMRLRRLTGLERVKIEEELDKLRELIAEYKDILAHDYRVLEVIKEELGEIKKKFGNARRTLIEGNTQDLNEEDLIADDNMVVTITQSGYIKRMSVDLYKQQKRGGKGMQGANLKEDDFVQDMFIATNHNYILFFSSKGKVYKLKVYNIPETSRHARGTAIVNLLPLEQDEEIQTVITTKDFPENEYFLFATKRGVVKKTAMNKYARVLKNGIIAINLNDGDELVSVIKVKDSSRAVMVSSEGKAICFDVEEIRSMGRTATGVRGMRISDNAHILNMEAVRENTDVLVITEKGYGKRTAAGEYTVHHRGGRGMTTITMTQKKGALCGMLVVEESDEIMVSTESGIIVRTPVSGISKSGRSAQGVRIMNVAEGDKVVALAVSTDDEEEEQSVT